MVVHEFFLKPFGSSREGSNIVGIARCDLSASA
ncbi:hypothetical protein BX589_102370 [Paraburkholderia fungorum]|nr:hypothetical protein BX589_102370 [Paraburkholderia fungorum]